MEFAKSLIQLLTTRAIGAKIKQGYSLYTVLHTIKQYKTTGKMGNWTDIHIIYSLLIEFSWLDSHLESLYHIIFHTAKWLVGSILQLNLSIPSKFYLHDVNIYFTLLFEPIIELFINCKHAQTICLLHQLYKLIIIAITMMFSMSLILPSLVSL